MLKLEAQRIINGRNELAKQAYYELQDLASVCEDYDKSLYDYNSLVTATVHYIMQQFGLDINNDLAFDTILGIIDEGLVSPSFKQFDEIIWSLKEVGIICHEELLQI